MKTVWIASLAIAASTSALAQSTIYKLVDDSGRVTYSNRPMKGAVPLELEPLNTIPGAPAGSPKQAKPAANADKSPVMENAEVAGKVQAGARVEPVAASARPAVAVVTPVSQRTSIAAVEPSTQKRRDNDRRKILEDELTQEEQSLAGARAALATERQNPQLVAAVRAASQAENPTAAQLVEFRSHIDKASGRIRGLQATVAEHEKNIGALKRELGALKP